MSLKLAINAPNFIGWVCVRISLQNVRAFIGHAMVYNTATF